MIATLLTSKKSRLAFVLTIALLIPFSGCKKMKTASARSHRDKIDACQLITNAEVQAIEESPIKDAKSSEQSDGNFRIAQCFYTAETFNKSVSFVVTQSDPGSPKARNPKDYWKETFGRYEGEAKEEEGDVEKKKSLGREEEEE